MAGIQFRMNSQPLNFFRAADFGNEDTIASLKGNDGIKSGGTLSKSIFRSWSRTDAEKEANNQVRTKLLEALGNAFGVTGISKSDGKVRFSAAFMDRLEQILGKGVFKKSDFGVKGPDGTVTSGKPLTQRRIQAILTKATVVGATPLNRDSIAVYEARLATIAKKINLDAYEATLKTFANLEGDAKLEAEGNLANKFPVQAHFHAVKKALAFYKDELPKFLQENLHFSEDALKDADGMPDYLRDELAKYQMFNADVKRYVKYDSLAGVKEYLNKHCGIYVHTENAATAMTFSNMEDPVKEMTAYLDTAVSQFVQESINGYIAAEKAGKGTDFIKAAASACIEAKSGQMQAYIAQNGLAPQVEGEENFSVTEILDAADSAQDKKTTLDNCIYNELQKIAADAKEAGINTDGWTWKDVAASVKKALVGKERPIMVPGQSLTGFVNLTEGGKEVVREVTAKDLDMIGQQCMDYLKIF